jgi:hypothetical protein
VIVISIVGSVSRRRISVITAPTINPTMTPPTIPPTNCMLASSSENPAPTAAAIATR